MKPILSIIIVSWNVQEALRENLARLFELTDEVYFEVIVVDNASVDGTRAMVRREFPQVELVSNDWNSGFAHACNQGLELAKGDVMVLLNPDMKVVQGTLGRTHNLLMENLAIGVLGVKLLDGEGKPIASVRRDPSIVDQLALLLKVPHLLKLKAIDRYLATDFDYTRTQNVDHVRGSYFAFRRDVMDVVGMLDERYFIWFEEVDFCKRVREAGYQIRYCAEAECHDLVGQSFAQVKVARKQALFSKSMISYFAKWHPWWQSAILRVVRPFAITAGAVYDLVKR